LQKLGIVCLRFATSEAERSSAQGATRIRAKLLGVPHSRIDLFIRMEATTSKPSSSPFSF